MPYRVITLMAVLVAAMTLGASPAALGSPIVPPDDAAAEMAVTGLAQLISSQPKPTAKQPALPKYPALTALRRKALRNTNRKIVEYRSSTWHWQKIMGRRTTRSNYNTETARSVPYGKWVMRLWKHRSHRLHQSALRWMTDRIQGYKQTVRHWNIVMGVSSKRTLASASNKETRFKQWRKIARSTLHQARNVPRESSWECIHHYEGSWQDRGAPYYGGLQMDITFQRHYGGYLLATKGTADNWTPLEQMWVAEKAYRSGRGFHPWPNTARYCGLL